jgi:hypothetical protein
MRFFIPTSGVFLRMTSVAFTLCHVRGFALTDRLRIDS